MTPLYLELLDLVVVLLQVLVSNATFGISDIPVLYQLLAILVGTCAFIQQLLIVPSLPLLDKYLLLFCSTAILCNLRFCFQRSSCCILSLTTPANLHATLSSATLRDM